MSSFIIDILEDFLGDNRGLNENSCQIRFDCPACASDKGLSHGDGKGNLEINYEKGVYKCWSCKDTNDMSGYIPKLIRKYGKKKHLRQFNILKPEFKRSEDKYINALPVEVTLPESFKSLSTEHKDDIFYKEAIKYLNKRNIGKEIINYYNIGYTVKGKYFFRIIIPSYDSSGDLNYFAARSFSWVKPKYLNVKKDKTTVIFNENKINWDSTIYLVEGPFDHIVTPNSIPLLGKYVYDLLFNTLLEKANADIVVVLDPDARTDAEILFKQLFYSRLCHKVKIVFLPEGYDISDIHKIYGKKGVMKVLSTAKRLDGFKILK